MSVRSRTGVLGKGTPRVPPPGGSGCIQDGTTLGQLAQWDPVTECWVPVAAPNAVGDIAVWNGTEWVAVQPGENLFAQFDIMYSAVNVLAGTQYLTARVSNTNTSNDINTVGGYVAEGGEILSGLMVRHGTASASAEVLTYTVLVNGNPTALTGQLACNAIAHFFDFASIGLVLNDYVSVQVTGATVTRAVAPYGLVYIQRPLSFVP